jgi:hypothetical protein
MYMSVGVMKDYKLKLWKLRASHARGTGTPKDKDVQVRRLEMFVYYESMKRKLI